MENKKTPPIIGRIIETKIVEKDFSVITKQSNYINLQNAISEMTKEKTLQKVFTFTMEDMQDFPIKCLAEMNEYLEEHNSRIDSYYFTSNINSDTFVPELTMHIIPIESIREHMSNDLWLKLANADVRVERIKESLKGILSNYLFEFNNSETRSAMISTITSWFKNLTNDSFEIIDETEVVTAERGAFNFVVLKDGYRSEKRYSLGEYIQFLHENNLLIKS